MKKFIKQIVPDPIKYYVKWHIASRQLIKGDDAWALNCKYDMETWEIMSQALKKDSNALDIGCSKGKFLYDILRLAPEGQHHAFEPIPKSFNLIKSKFKNKNCTLHNVALSNVEGTADFFVASNTGYSGLKKTEKAIKQFGDTHEKITVKTMRLDDIIPKDFPVDFIKIDVEGAEYWVFEGAKETIRRTQPMIVFECDSHAKAFNMDPGKLHDLLDEVGIGIWNTGYYMRKKECYSREEFIHVFNKGYEYYFIAGPKSKQ